MTAIHMTLQHKGGAGKTTVTYLLAQYLKEQGQKPVCIDADPFNSSLALYKGLEAAVFPLKDDDSQVDEDKVADLIEHLLAEKKTFVVDNGAGSFSQVCNLLVKSGVDEVLLQSKRDLFVHVVINGGPDMPITFAGLDALAKQLPEPIKIVVWVNEFFGPVQAEGKAFEQMKIYSQLKNRVSGLVRIPQYKSYFKKNFETMLLNRLTFKEAINGTLFRTLEKQRLVMMERELYEQLDAIFQADLSQDTREINKDKVLTTV
ncbi:MAG: AAA family ATPase [Vampirovibrionales bacterium]|nr:AAA family ATPase [Vampirovibrionales bacterium]